MLERALVIGCANAVWDEVAEAKRLYNFDCIIAVNNAGVSYPDHVDHWVSFHIDLFPHWRDLRRKAGFSEVNSFWTAIYRGSPLFQKSKFPVRRVHCNGGSSGLIGAMVAIQLAQNVVLAGIPMDPNRDHHDKAGAWDEALQHRKAWETYLPQLKGRVISMSGWTKELLRCL